MANKQSKTFNDDDFDEKEKPTTLKVTEAEKTPDEQEEQRLRTIADADLWRDPQSRYEFFKKLTKIMPTEEIMRKIRVGMPAENPPPK